MNVLLLGSGGREHALAAALIRSPLLTKLFIAPGNPGTAQCGENVVIDIMSGQAVIDFCRVMGIGFVVVGPEAPLVAGIADEISAAGIKVFGPSKLAAQLEGSKAFTKMICDKADIPTARYKSFTDAAAARTYVQGEGAPIVVKYDGLMAGKGVTVAATVAEAEEAIEVIYANEPGAKIVIEECMVGEEASFFCLLDGETVLPLASAQDHKRVFDGDKGPNTGGMGAYSPAPVMTPEMEALALETIVRPTARTMATLGMPYRGVLFVGLMITAQGPKLIEYNCRFGDPECQVLMLRLKDDLLTLLLATVDGQLAHASVRWKDDTALTVVMAANGYPGDYAKGSEIRGVEAAGKLPGATIFHAGTKTDAGRLLSAGGRVLNISAVGADAREARARAYAAVDAVDWPGGFCRRDIAMRAMERE